MYEVWSTATFGTPNDVTAFYDGTTEDSSSSNAAFLFAMKPAV